MIEHRQLGLAFLNVTAFLNVKSRCNLVSLNKSRTWHAMQLRNFRAGPDKPLKHANQAWHGQARQLHANCAGGQRPLIVNTSVCCKLPNKGHNYSLSPANSLSMQERTRKGHRIEPSTMQKSQRPSDNNIS
eukprot:scaffold295707_cov21-Tisochrysis_lutea.AAC.1